MCQRDSQKTFQGLLKFLIEIFLLLQITIIIGI